MRKERIKTIWKNGLRSAHGSCYAAGYGLSRHRTFFSFLHAPNADYLTFYRLLALAGRHCLNAGTRIPVWFDLFVYINHPSLVWRKQKLDAIYTRHVTKHLYIMVIHLLAVWQWCYRYSKMDSIVQHCYCYFFRICLVAIMFFSDE